MRKPLIAGNWKMHHTIAQGVALAQEMLSRVADAPADVCLCVPYISLERIGRVLAPSDILLGAQNMHYEKEGAFTGEISPMMLAALKVAYVILGHSERRAYNNETDEVINLKIRAGLAHKLTPIVCCGESLETREKGQEKEHVKGQLTGCLKGIKKEDVANLVIAYEPIWAIGTGKTASNDQADQMCGAIREMVAEDYDQPTADKVRILYGGSVNPKNIDGLMSMANIDGALVGGASLDPDAFSRLVHYEKES